MSLKKISKYWQVWFTITKHAFAETLVSRWSSLLFLSGKTMRFGMSLFFLFLLQKNTNGVGGYTTEQVIAFFLTYQFIDTLAQMSFRGVYLFSSKVKSGDLDFLLSKPINPLFRALTGNPDILDAFFFVPTTALTIYFLLQSSIGVSLWTGLLFVALLVNAFFIAASLHIFVLCLGVLTTEVDNAIMLYRDFNNLAKFPVDMYREPLRSILFFVVPVGLMNTIPAQVLLERPTSHSIFLTFAVGIGFLMLSLAAWRFSLRKYTSAGG